MDKVETLQRIMIYDDEIGTLLSEKYSAANRLFAIDLRHSRPTLHAKIESRKNAHKVKQEREERMYRIF